MPDARRSNKIRPLKDYEEILWHPEEPKEIETIPVRLMKDLIVKVIGEATGNLYIFNGAGSIVNIDKSDIETINRKNIRHKSCCGGYSSPYFDIL